MVKEVNEYSSKLHSQPTFSFPTALSSRNTLAWDLLLLLISSTLTLTKDWTENKLHSHYPLSLTADHWELSTKASFPMSWLPISLLLHLHFISIGSLQEHQMKVCERKCVKLKCHPTLLPQPECLTTRTRNVIWTLSAIEKVVLIP